MQFLEALGYRCSRSAASLGVFDVIAIGTEDVLLVQTKSNTWPRKDEMETLRSFICPPNCYKIIHRWRDYQKTPDIKRV